MAIKLKTKVALGGVFLFTLLITAAVISFVYFYRASQDAEAVVKDNYESLNYSKDMLKELDSITADGISRFEKILLQQEKNITEPGEENYTLSLRKNISLLKTSGNPDSITVKLRRDINDIMHLNLQAINKKNTKAQQTSENAKTIITLCLTICLLMGLTFIFNFPSLVASPLAKLTEGIRAITNKNYSLRIHLDRKDEFGELAEAFNTMAERLDEYEHSNLSKILFEKQRAEAVINSLKDASIGIDKKGTVLFANQQALQLLNLRDQEIVGMQQEEVKKRNDLFRFLVNEQNSIPFKIVVDGKENYFTKEIIEMLHEGIATGNVIVLKNITPFKELDVAKTNFIATVSHELKTPLASSDFSLKLLQDERLGTLSEEQRELVQSLREDNKRLLRILSELLDMSQVESGKIQLNIQAVQPASMTDKAIESVANMAKEKNIHLIKELQADLPLIKADADKTIWVLNNFLTNAIHYSANDSTIIISVRHTENIVEFAVQDFGKGIEAKYLDKIFDKYFKVPGSTKGTGLGLSICKELIEAQGGQIFATSRPGEGSRFCFRLSL